MLRSVLLCTLLFTSAASAAPTVALVGVHQDALGLRSQQRAMDQLAEALTSDGRLSPLVGEALHQALKGREALIVREGFLFPGRELLAQGKERYRQAQPEEAIPVLEQAVADLSSAVAPTNDTQSLWEAWMLLGMAHTQRDDQAAAERAWGAAITLDPQRSPDAAQFPPDVLERYDAVRQALQEYRAILTVTAGAEDDVEIYVNGVDRGLAPVTLYDILPGENHLVARGLAATQAHRVVQVDAGGQLTIDLKTQKPALGVAADTGAGRARQIAGLYRLLGDRLDVDYLLLAGTHDQLLSLQLYDARHHAFSRATEVPVEDGAGDELLGAVPLLLGVLDADGALRSKLSAPSALPLDVAANVWLAEALLNPDKARRVAPPPPVDGGKRVPWVAIGIASGVGAAAITTGALLYKRPVQTIQLPDEELKSGSIEVVVE